MALLRWLGGSPLDGLWKTIYVTLTLLSVSARGQMNYGAVRETAATYPAVSESLHAPLEVSQRDNFVKIGMSLSVEITSTTWFNETFVNETDVVLKFVPSQAGIIEPISDITINDPRSLKGWNYTLVIPTLEAGQVVVTIVAEGKSQNYTISSLYFRVSVYKFAILRVISQVVGWLYFAAWSVSFYPQIYQNWRRRSVRGLSLDFVYLNWTGFLLYSLFNLGLFLIPAIQVQYLQRNPTGLIPVQINDLVFSVHALFACTVTCLQCLSYDKGAQTISKTGKTLLTTVYAAIFIVLIITVSGGVLWLDFLIACSTIKLIITLVKYVPQAYLNYTRKSTSGWCIGNVLLDLTGGILSMGQMILLAYNSNDWISFFGDYTKFGLGAFSIIFDIIFMVQHYGLYRNHEAYEPIEGSTIPIANDHEDMVTSNNLQTTESEGGHEHGLSANFHASE